MKANILFTKLILPIFCAAVLSSCSYGFNFTAETGSLELNLEFVNDNAMDIDKVKYELTPPKGLSSTVSSDISGSYSYRSIDKMDTGSWSISAGLYADGELIQEFSYSIEVINNTRTKLRMESRWNGSEYEISFQSWQEPEDDDGSSSVDLDFSGDPDFDVTEIRLIPAYYINNFTDEEFYTVNVLIFGSNLDSGIQSLALNYPDGYKYEYGYDYIYNRSLLTVYQDSDSMIEILRNQLIPGSGPNGNYSLRLSDYKGVTTEDSELLSFDYQSITPVITGYNADSIVPATISGPGTHDFGYEFNSTAGIGTRLVFLINRTTNIILPPDDTMAVMSDVGTLPSPALDPGLWEFIVAAIGYSTFMPVTDATGADISSDGLKSENLAASIYQIYGENTGYVCYRSSTFVVPNP